MQPGDPFLLDPDGRVDARLTRYFSRSMFARLAPETKRNYSGDCCLFFNFLSNRGRHWAAATEDDWLDYEHWRRWNPENPGRVGDAKWDRELAAINRLYKWAGRYGHARNPISHRTIQARNGMTIDVPATRSVGAKTSDVRWLTPRAFRLWRDVGLRGYGADNTRDRRWAGRSDDRNAAYSDLLFSSGMRRTEGGSLFVDELPTLAGDGRFFDGRLGQAVTKGRRGRTFYVSRDALRAIDGYCRTSRRAAIRRAQAQGRYDAVPGLRVITGRTGFKHTVLHWREDGRPRSAAIGNLAPDERARIFVEGENGLEPMWLWLAENGLPFSPHSWEGVFQSASRRCQSVLRGRPGDKLFMTPHMARHSFALHMLVALNHAMDRRFGLSADERRDLRMLYGDPWSMVQDLLGHRSVETTKRVYLAPVSDLQVRSLLLDDFDVETTEILAALARSTERVQDVC